MSQHVLHEFNKYSNTQNDVEKYTRGDKFRKSYQHLFTGFLFLDKNATVATAVVISPFTHSNCSLAHSSHLKSLIK